jgi:hypothetical protein
MARNLRTVDGIFRDGKVELSESPAGVNEARVIVTFLPDPGGNLTELGLDLDQAASLRARLATFEDDWERPEMEAYDAL